MLGVNFWGGTEALDWRNRAEKSAGKFSEKFAGDFLTFAGPNSKKQNSPQIRSAEPRDQHIAGWLRNRTGAGNRNRRNRFQDRNDNWNRLNRSSGTETQKTREGCCCPKFAAGNILPENLSAAGKFCTDFPAARNAIPAQGLGIFRQGKWLLENRPRLRERSWTFSSETATAFLSSSEKPEPQPRFHRNPFPHAQELLEPPTAPCANRNRTEANRGHSDSRRDKS